MSGFDKSLLFMPGWHALFLPNESVLSCFAACEQRMHQLFQAEVNTSCVHLLFLFLLRFLSDAMVSTALGRCELDVDRRRVLN